MSRNYKLLSVLIAVVALTPILVAVGYMFDSEGHAMYFFTQDTDYLDVIMAHGWYTMYSLFWLVNEISILTGVEPKLFFNFLAVISILGIAKETYVYLQERFELSKRSACIGAWFVLAFPVWHVAIASFFVSHLICLWLFMLAVNWRKRNIVLSVLFLFSSINLFSLFPFAIGFACVEFLMDANRENYKRQAAQVIAFSLAMVVLYLILTSIVSVSGYSGKYNAISFRFQSLLHYCILSAILGVVWLLVSRVSERGESERLLRVLLSFLALSFFAAFAYWAVDRPLRYLTFGSFTSRHTILTCIPFALLCGVVAEELFKRWGERITHSIAAFIMTAAIVLLYQGYDHKVAALMFKDMLTNSLKQTEAPESGYVSIEPVGYQAPRHVHNYSINMCFYKAYGRMAWMANGFWARRGFVYDKTTLEKLYDMPEVELKLHLAHEVTGDAFTKYSFKLDDYHQEGRLWYWYYYLVNDYSSFKPQLVKS